MNNLFGIAVVVIAVVVLLTFLKNEQQPALQALPYESRQVLFSPAEQSFLRVLEPALGGGFQVFGKVRMNDIIEVKRDLPKAAWQAAEDKIDRKHVDFVVCQKDDLSIVAVIELDDEANTRRDRVKLDEFYDQAFAAAGIPYLHFPVKPSYILEDLRGRLSFAGAATGILD